MSQNKNNNPQFCNQVSNMDDCNEYCNRNTNSMTDTTAQNKSNQSKKKQNNKKQGSH